MDQTESDTCPRCRTTKYRNPTMKLMINLCGHPLCETCVDQVFFRGSAPCPKCARQLKKSDFREQVFEDSYIEKEIVIRKKLMKEFQDKEDDFPSLKEFNDYLETIETFIFNLANNYDEEKTQQAIEDLKKDLKAKRQKKKKVEPRKENAIFVYESKKVDTFGPEAPAIDLIKKEYTKNCMPILYSSHLPGGFQANMPIQRALQEAFSGLYLSIRT